MSPYGPYRHWLCRPRGDEEKTMTDEKSAAEPSGASGGSVAEAWLVSLGGHTSVMLSGRLAEQRKRNGCEVVPLYRQPTLTDAEREAIERLCEATNDMIDNDKRAGGCFWQDDAAAVAAARGLLARLGGGR